MSFFETTASALVWILFWSVIVSAVTTLYLRYYKKNLAYIDNTMFRFILLTSMIFLGISVGFLILIGLLYILSNMVLY